MPMRRTQCRGFLAAGIAIAVLGVLSAAPVTAVAEIYALDGDDICIGGHGKRCTDGEDYRLHGVDAFETGQTCTKADGHSYKCGTEARKALDAIIAGRPVSCVPTKRDGRRWIGNCNAGRFDVEMELVRSGWAFVRPDFLSTERAVQLCAIEAEARAAKRGLWAGAWDMRPFFRKGGFKKTLVEISCAPHDAAASQ